MAAHLDAALQRAVDLARKGPLAGGNPRVGCVIVDGDGRVLGEGWHRGAGTPHAEAAALADAARRAGSPADDIPSLVRGGPASLSADATAVVTLEPCNHTGRTDPCSRALLAAGVRRVVYAVPDVNPVAAGGAAWLADHGVEVRTAAEMGIDSAVRDQAEELIGPWLTAVRRGRPWVIGKTATTLDGRVAAADRTSRWITGPQARAHAHTVRAGVDAIVVGTGTVLTDDPALTARSATGELLAHQPLRVVVGERAVPADARVRQGPGEWLHLPIRDLGAALAELDRRGARRVLVEGGPRLLTAALSAGLVDELHSYVAPVLLGAGPTGVADLGIRTIADAVRWKPVQIRVLGEDVFIAARTGAADADDLRHETNEPTASSSSGPTRAGARTDAPRAAPTLAGAEPSLAGAEPSFVGAESSLVGAESSLVGAAAALPAPSYSAERKH